MAQERGKDMAQERGKMDKVDVIIVNYRTAELTMQAVRSVLGEPDLGKVVVVENGSPDDSANKLQSIESDPRMRLVVSKRNLGFGGGNNVAVRHANSRYIFFLNSDAYVKPGCLRILMKRLAEDKAVGLIAPAIYVEEGGALQLDAQGEFPTPTSLLLRKTHRVSDSLAPDWVSGAAFMARREEFKALGGFDERLFMYFEDVDLCRRYRDQGKGILREPSASVIHLGGKSRQSTAMQKKSYYKSQDVYLKLAGSLPMGRLFVKIARSSHNFIESILSWK
jgi:N-acetylglucosaminyl-diphospho-decaprenol L-rhamnosyltransferase